MDGDRLVLNISNQIVAGEKVRVSGEQAPASSVALRAP
jgi:hypothetical protein